MSCFWRIGSFSGANWAPEKQFFTDIYREQGPYKTTHEILVLIPYGHNHLKHRPPDKIEYWKIIFFISHPKHTLWVLKRTRLNETFEHPKHMFK